MTNNHLNNLSNNSSSHNSAHKTPSLVPKNITIGLFAFALVLSLAGYVFRLIVGDPLKEVLLHAAVLVPVFVIVIPVGFWIGALIMNKIKGMNIQRRNALTLGWLTSCVTILWLMGTYS